METYFQLSPELQDLKRAISIRAPGKASQAGVGSREQLPTVMSFSRTREVDLPWDKIAELVGDVRFGASEISLLRQEFENAWQIWPDRGVNLQVLSGKEYRQRPGLSADAKDGELEEDAFVIGIEGSGRAFALTLKAGMKATAVGTPLDSDILASAESAVEVYSPVAAASADSAISLLSAEFANIMKGPSATRPLLDPILFSQSTAFNERLWLKQLAANPLPQVSLKELTEFVESAAKGAKPEHVKLLSDEEFSNEYKRAPGSGVPPAPPAESAPAAVPTTGAGAAPAAPGTVDKAPDHVVISLGEQGAHWRLEPAQGWTAEVLHKGLTGTADDYDEAWRKGVKAAEPLGFVTDAAADQNLPVWSLVEEVDLGLGAVAQEMELLRARLDGIEPLIKNLDAKIEEAAGNVEEFEDLQKLVSRRATFRTEQMSLRSRATLISQRAERLGYLISIDDLNDTKARALIAHTMGEIPRAKAEGDPSDESIQAGVVYKIVPKIVSWSETYKDIEMRGVLVSKKWGKPKYEDRPFDVLRTRQRTAQYQGKTEVRPDLEPWVIQRNAFTKGGRSCHVLDLSENGYVDENGIALSTILDQGRLDESFRRNLVLFMPVYEQSLVEGWVKTKMLVVQAPRPGLTWARLPRLLIEEHYSYRTEWVGTEVGEVVASLNLAPGETRKISVTRSFSYSSSRNSSVSSVLDITTSASDDFASNLEQEARREQSENRATTWNVKAQGAKGPFKAEAGATGASSRTSSEFAREFESLARKSARTMTQNSKVEVKTEQSESIAITTADESIGEIKNINAGRTMNLLFNRLYNVYSGGIFLEDIRLIYISPAEVFKGSGLFEPMTYRLVDATVPAARIGDALSAMSAVAPEKRVKLQEIIETALWDEVRSEASEVVRPEAQQTRLLLPQDRPLELAAAPSDGSKAKQKSEDRKGEKDSRLGEAERLSLRDSPVLPHVLRVPANAVYLDVMLGVGEATEPYSEEIRHAEIDERRARTARLQAEAAAIASSAPVTIEVSSDERTLRSPVIEDIDYTDGAVVFKLSGSLPSGIWAAYDQGQRLGLVETDGLVARLRHGTPLKLDRARLIELSAKLVVRSGG